MDSIILYNLPEVDSYKQKEIVDQLKQYSLFVKNHSNAYGYYNVINNGVHPSDYAEFLDCSINYINENDIEGG